MTTNFCQAMVNRPPTPPGSRDFGFLLLGRAEELSTLRRDLNRWLADVGVTDRDSVDIVLAVDEAATNAIEHARGGDAGPVTVSGRLTPHSDVVVEIADRGVWRRPHSRRGGGHGLALMRVLCDHVEINHDTGTVVKLTRRRRAGVAGS